MVAMEKEQKTASSMMTVERFPFRLKDKGGSYESQEHEQSEHRTTVD
jgi:hypothetical protein